MPRELIETFLDLSVPDNKRRLLRVIGTMSGFYDVTLRPRRAMRTNAQNRYYFGVVVKAFVEFLAEQGETVSTEEAHLLIKSKFLTREVVNRNTGEPIGQTLRSVTELDVNDMAEYLDRVIHWLAETFGIIVPEPDTYMARDTGPIADPNPQRERRSTMRY